VLSDDSNGLGRAHLHVRLVVFAEEHVFRVIDSDASGQYDLSSPASEFAHPLMVDDEVLRQRKEENAVEASPARLGDPNAATPDAGCISLIEEVYELRHASRLRPHGLPARGRAVFQPLATSAAATDPPDPCTTC